ncbi:Rieske (2Fe-2S) protein [Prosthecomicrobium pneumaticum]|uniref:3-phenylpropionate/trans-cinnamate dioxygenase ferredoxin subunit n=1 Tax=Prosthecomicrobium pneumaticum TaxID=81895 RepID=A0A7W9FQX8_9HYPH|nr:Rieske (2Fe-2S) protein [Prosthecomicrobium pneumaticum]MBB5755188.1 3-phenylpropionate/trans-cinnamate dioxygenase ferredoxin subunit [Prosthecomicrobium pneumaticum]
MARYVVATTGDIPVGTNKVVTVRGREIAVFNVKGAFYAFLNKCPHEGARLCHGAVVGLVRSDEPGTFEYTRQGEILRCPWHGWEFDIRTGQSWVDPENTWVKNYPASIERGGKLVEGPYKAEVFPVSVEEDYVVLEV